MKTKCLLTLCFVILHSSFIRSTNAQGTGFTYQGRLNDGANPATGIYDLRFTIYDSTNSPGVLIAGPLTNAAVGVSNGLFAVKLDFGAAVFTGPDRWLEIGVRTNGSGAFDGLVPRQKLTPAPYAIFANSASNLSGTLPGAGLAGVYPGAVALNNPANSFSGTYTGDGAGVSNVNALTLGGLASSNFWQTGGNTVGAGQFLGSQNDQAVEFRVRGNRALRLEPTAIDANHAGIVNTVGGSPANFVAPGIYGAAIAGGGAANYFGVSSNVVLADFGFIGGGYQNQILDNALSATIGGGYQNTIGTFAYDSTIAGGGVNTIQQNAWDSAIAGGHFNAILSLAAGSSIGGGYFNIIQSSAFDSSIGGGAYNTIQAGAQYATVPGGYFNSAAGSYAFAAGRRAQANHPGAFVWGDSTDADIASTANDQFVLRASGGFYLYGPGSAPWLSLNPAGASAEFNVGGQRALRLESPVNGVGHSNIVNVLAGSSANIVAAGVYGATIAGGGAMDYSGFSGTNMISADFGTIGGGYRNTVQPQSRAATIGGGWDNVIQTNASYSFIGGGDNNTIQTDASTSTIGGGTANSIQAGASDSTIGGGHQNTISNLAQFATISGGFFNAAQAPYAVVAGGDLNVAAGRHSFAAGHRAKANHQGAFIWCDSLNQDGISQGTNTFTARASGGYFLFSSSGATGVQVPAGSGSWSSISDRNAKENFQAVDSSDILKRLTALPLTTWNYQTQDKSIRHLGPVAQDFRAAFGIGEDDRHIATVDADGVALAAIQGLNEKVEVRSQKSEDRSRRLEEKLQLKETEIAELKRTVTELKELVQAMNDKLNGGAK